MPDRQTHPAANLFPIMDDAELARLADDIKTNGLKIPIVLLDDKILDGRNRYRACKLAGVTPEYVAHNNGDPWRAVWSLNRERRHITDKVRLALIGADMILGSDNWKAKQEKARAETSKARSESGRETGRGHKKGAASADARPLPDSSRKASSRLGSELGVSMATVERALELAKKSPEAAAAVKSGEMEGRAALRDAKRADRVAKLAAIATGNKTLDGECGLAAVLYSDPPWRYDDSSTDPTRVIENQYPTINHEEMCALGEKVRGICTPDAILYLWVPSPILEQGLAVLRAWGFEYKTGAVWDKQKIGMGYYFRQQHEHLLVGERGTMPKPEPSTLESSVYVEKRGEHSVKPTHYYEMLEREYPGLPKRELFARSAARPGWLPTWGNQAT